MKKLPKFKRKDFLDPAERDFHARCYDITAASRPLKPPACKLPEPVSRASKRALRRDRELGITGDGGYLYVRGGYAGCRARIKSQRDGEK